MAVDTLRLLAIVGVIIIHTGPFRDLSLEQTTHEYNLLGVVFNQLARFAVPFFFTVSGYFWGLKLRSGTPLPAVSMQMAKRLLLVLMAGTILYALPYNAGAFYEYGALGPLKVWYWHLHSFASSPYLLLFESTSQHLWFLIALLWALAIASVFVYIRQVWILVIVALALYVFGVLALPYSKTPVGVAFSFYTLEGPFFGTLFFTMGYLLSRFTPRMEWLRIGLLLTVAGFAIHFAEVFALWKWWQIRPFHHYVFGTILIGLGVAMIALSDPPALRIKELAEAGRFTLGVYVIHIVFTDWVAPVKAVTSNPAWEVGRIFLILGLSLVVVRWLARYKRFKRLVT